METQKLTYKKRSRVREHEETVKALTPTITPMPRFHDAPAIQVKRGRKKAIVENFEDDPRAANMGVFIGQGLSPMEAGILANFAPEQLQELQKSSDSYRRFVENQLIRFKQKHLKVISDKSDPKTSQWLLEKTFPTEYAQPKRSDGGHGEGSSTVIAAIFRTVQRQQDTPIPTDYVDITTSKEEEQGHDEGDDDRESLPSLDVGGANIIR